MDASKSAVLSLYHVVVQTATAVQAASNATPIKRTTEDGLKPPF